MTPTDENEQAENSTASGVFVVRVLADGTERYEVCQRVTTVDGEHRLPGTGQTVAELVDRQGLKAAGISGDDAQGLEDVAFMAQSGNDIDDD